MARLPYDRIAPIANNMIQKMTTAPDMEVADYYWEAYVAFLEANGWTTVEFDKETVKRVEEGWDEEKSTVWN